MDGNHHNLDDCRLQVLLYYLPKVYSTLTSSVKEIVGPSGGHEKKIEFAENHARAHILVSQQLNSTFLNLNEMATFSYELADSDIIGHPIRKNTSDSNSNWTSREDFEDLYDSGSSH